MVDLDVTALSPAELLQLLPECREISLIFPIILGKCHQDSDPPHSLALLRPRRERPRGRRAAEQRDELATFHSITSLASASSVGGTSRPSAFALLRLMTSSNFVGCSTGISAGLSPFRILSTSSAARRYSCRRSAPYDSSPPDSTNSRLL